MRALRARGRAALGGALALDERGQMTVELAVMAPVAIVVALVVLNLMGYVEACAAFDQAAPDAVLAHGVAPAGGQAREDAEREVADALASALGREGRCEVEVRCEDAAGAADDAPGLVSPLLTRFVCTLTYRPWPSLLRLPGISLESPLALRHECEIVVDRYRSGVVV